MKLEAGELDVITLLPLPIIAIHPKKIEVGVYFLKYFLTLNITL